MSSMNRPIGTTLGVMMSSKENVRFVSLADESSVASSLVAAVVGSLCCGRKSASTSPTMDRPRAVAKRTL